MSKQEEKQIRKGKILIGLMEYLVILGCLVTLFVMLTPKEKITKIANSYAKPEEVTKYNISDGYVTRIRPLTDYTIFKQIAEDTINQDADESEYGVKVYEDSNKQKEIKDGYIVSGMVIEFSLKNQNTSATDAIDTDIEENEEDQEDEEIVSSFDCIASVIGDTTQNGDCNIVELTQIIRHIIGIDRFKDQIEELSADFNGDGQINVYKLYCLWNAGIR